MTEYAKDVLVSADWADDHLDAFWSDDPEYRLVEVDVDTEAYDDSHAPGAVGFNWETSCRTRPGATSSTGTTSRPCWGATASPRTRRWSSTATTPTGSRPTPTGSSDTTATM